MSQFDPAPLSHDADGPNGLLMLHGLTGAPTELRPLADAMLEAHPDWSLRLPLLPGHGTEPNDLRKTKWQDWSLCAREHFEELEARCERVFVAGMSMGGLLAMDLATQRADVAGLLLYAPAWEIEHPLLKLLPHAQRWIRYFPKGPPDLSDPRAYSTLFTYDRYPLRSIEEMLKMRAIVGRYAWRIRQPVIILQGERDASIPREAPQQLLEAVSSEDVAVHWFTHSGHVLTVDRDQAEVLARSIEFLTARAVT